MPTAPHVLAVCVNYDGAGVLEETLESLLADGYPSLEALVVDNASGDESWRLVKPPVQLMRLGENKGYAAAVNAALRARLHDRGRPPDYVLVLNNDLIIEPGTIHRLVGFAREREAAAVGPKVLDYQCPLRLEAAWGKVRWTHVLASYRGKGRADGPAWDRPRRAELLLGCALLIDRRTFTAVGLFDERFFMYHEEVDFLYRCRLARLAVYYCPTGVVRHRGAFSTRRTPCRKTYWVRRSTVIFMRKHRAGPLRWASWGLTLSASLFWNLVRLRGRRAKVIARGAIDGLRERAVLGESPS